MNFSFFTSEEYDSLLQFAANDCRDVSPIVDSDNIRNITGLSRTDEQIDQMFKDIVTDNDQ